MAKIEFFTSAPNAWGKSGRTYGALRFGSKLPLQYGPNTYRVLVDQMESERWYDVRVVYARGQIEAYVDGELLLTTTNPARRGVAARGVFDECVGPGRARGAPSAARPGGDPAFVELHAQVGGRAPSRPPRRRSPGRAHHVPSRPPR